MLNQKKHVVVVGMGMAGCMAACGAHAAGHSVTLLATGKGSLCIGSGCVDVLGYVRQGDAMRPVCGNPVEAANALAATSPAHPYALVGKDGIHAGLQAVQNIMKEQGIVLQCGQEQGDTYNDHAANTLVSTVMGTLKPTYLSTPSHHVQNLLVKDKGTRILVTSIDAIRDCFPGLITQELRQHPLFKDAIFATGSIPWLKGQGRRPLNPLDVARFVDTEEGRAWIVAELFLLAKDVDAFLMPPLLGMRHSAWQDVQERLQRPIVEMVSMPPGVGGYRLFEAFQRTLQQAGVNIVENATVIEAEIEAQTTQSRQGRRCTALMAKGEGPARRYAADAFVIATGGLLGGGIVTSPGRAHEAIFNIPIDVPTNPEAWSSTELFADHAFASMGVKVNERFVPTDAAGKALFSNVHFAGRILGAYDSVTEKSGNGVAAVTGWHVGNKMVGGDVC